MVLTPQWRIVVVAGTLLIAFVEWLLFELIRTPYGPPHDMLTLLGQEKYGEGRAQYQEQGSVLHGHKAVAGVSRSASI